MAPPQSPCCVHAARPPPTPSTPFSPLMPSTPATPLLPLPGRMRAPSESPFWQSVRGILDDSISAAVNPLDDSALDRSINSVMQDAELCLRESLTPSRNQALQPLKDLEKMSELLVQLVEQHQGILGPCVGDLFWPKAHYLVVPLSGMNSEVVEKERLLALQANICQLRTLLNPPPVVR